ncbi:hypothetical protein CHUAL_003878, partial [Chamberlinius hualienensis]
MLCVWIILLLWITVVDSQFYIRCTRPMDCPHGQFCDMSLGKPPICTSCIDCNKYNRHPGEVICVSNVIADCGPCHYGYKDTNHYNPAYRLEKCDRDPNIRNAATNINSS